MFENRLKELRIKKGINMKQAAVLLNMPYTTYVGYEKNEREPNSESLVQIANFYECSVDYLVGRSPFVKLQNDEKQTDIKRTQLLLNYDQLNDIGKLKLNEYSNDLVNSGNYAIQKQKEKHA